MKRIFRSSGWWPPLVTLATIAVLWQGSCQLFQIPPYLLPSPGNIVTAAQSLSVGQWFGDFIATMVVVILGYLLAIAVSIPLAVLLTASRLLSQTVVPLLVIVQSTPIVAIAPIIVVTLGAGVLPRVLITCLITFFPLVVSTTTGLRATPPELIELSRSLRAPRYREYTQIRLLYAIPYIFSALRISVTLAVIGAVVAEFVAAQEGLGYLILFSTSQLHVAMAFAALVVLVSSSLALYGIVTLLQGLLFPWSVPKRALP
ncbi:MAG: ABC transporter permease [Candidatus Lustribacter sp.]